jgi:hypothetical protein
VADLSAHDLPAHHLLQLLGRLLLLAPQLPQPQLLPAKAAADNGLRTRTA